MVFFFHKYKDFDAQKFQDNNEIYKSNVIFIFLFALETKVSFWKKKFKVFVSTS